MRLFILVAIAAIVLTLLAGCATENIDDKTASYNLQVIGIMLGFLGTTVAPIIVLWVKGKLDKKLDVQQDELLAKTDRQTNAIVNTTTAAVEVVGQKAADAVVVAAEKVAETVAQQVVDDGRRDRRSTDKPVLGG